MCDRTMQPTALQGALACPLWWHAVAVAMQSVQIRLSGANKWAWYQAAEEMGGRAATRDRSLVAVTECFSVSDFAGISR
jgi:hypothetical protein